MAETLDRKGQVALIAALRGRAERARRLAKITADSLAKIGLLQVAEECERQALAVNADAAPEEVGAFPFSPPSRTGPSRN